MRQLVRINEFGVDHLLLVIVEGATCEVH